MKRLFVLLLAAIMVLGLMAGCGSTTMKSTVSEESAVSESMEAPVEESIEEPEEASELDESEEADQVPLEELEEVPDRPVIEYPLVEEPTVMTYWMSWPPFLSSISDPDDAAMFQAMEAATGVTLDIISVSTEGADTDFMLRCASNDLTDLVQNAVRNYTGGGIKAIEDDIIVDLMPLMEEYSQNYYDILMSDENIYKNVVSDEGQMPGLYGMYADYYYTDTGYWIRQDLLDELDLATPTTLDELETVLSAFQNRGMTDAMLVRSDGSCEMLSRAYGADNKVVDGQVQLSGHSEEYRAFLTKMHEYYEKGYFSSDFVTYTESNKPPESLLYEDMCGIFTDDMASISGYVNGATAEGFDLRALGQVHLDENTPLNNGYIGSKVMGNFCLSISTQCEDPKLAVEYMDYLFSDEGFILANYGVEGVTYTVENGEYKFTDLIMNNDFDWTLCRDLYINPGFPSLKDLKAEELTYTDAQKAAEDIWVSAFDSNAETLPQDSWLVFNIEESDVIASLGPDLDTYMQEWRLSFITGQRDIESRWEEYVAGLESLDFDGYEAVYQQAYDRYISK